MTRSLHPCPACDRHIRAGETVCPFCSATVPDGFGASACAPVLLGAERLSRAALVCLAAGAMAVACSKASSSASEASGNGGSAATEAASAPTESARPSRDMRVAVYGGPAPPDSIREAMIQQLLREQLGAPSAQPSASNAPLASPSADGGALPRGAR
jgi:hypothetical protein